MAVTLVSLRRSLCVAAVLLLSSGCAHTVTFPSADRDSPGSAGALLFRPTGTGPFPGIVLLHGGTGVEPNQREWAAWLADNGYVAMLVDSGRDAHSQSMKAHALGALSYLRSLSSVAGSRVAVMGFSRGGGAALAAVFEPQDARPAGHGFRAGVIFYPPGCSYRFQRTEVPLLLLLGQLDGSPEPCLDLKRRLETAGRAPIALVIYPNTYHAFDDSRATTPFAYGGVTILYNAQATADARVRILAFLSEQLRGAR